MLIGLTGTPECGKDELAQKMVEHDVYEQYCFADPVKNMLKQLHIREDVWTNDDARYRSIPWLGKSPEYLLNSLLVGWGMNSVDKNLWVLMAEGRWHMVNADNEGRMVIPDVQLGNEAKWIVEAGGFLLRVESPDDDSNVSYFPDALCHATVSNDGDDLREAAWDVINAKLSKLR